ncbi:MAG: hypothetical protein ABJ275_11860 [Maricaulaceae bacterium]
MVETIQYIHLAPETSPSATISERPFSAVIATTVEITSDWRHLVSEWLIKEGCRCTMAWGKDGTLWDDSVDIAHLEAFDWGDIPDNKMIMTTWHDDETLSDVLWSAKHSIFHPPESVINHLIILDISNEPRENYLIDLFNTACEDDD